jgi:hypothetical protein
MTGRSRLRTALLLGPPALITLAVLGLLVFGFVAGRMADRTAEDKAREVLARIERTGLTYGQAEAAINERSVDPSAESPEELVAVDGTEPYGFATEPGRVTFRLRTDTIVARCVRVVVPRTGSAGATAEDC